MAKKNEEATPTVAALVGDMPDGPGEMVPGLAEERAKSLEQENLELRRKLNDSGKMVNPMTLASAARPSSVRGRTCGAGPSPTTEPR